MSFCCVYRIDHRFVDGFFRGQCRISNLPADARIEATHSMGKGIDLRVHSVTFPSVPRGKPLPVVTAVVEWLEEGLHH